MQSEVTPISTSTTGSVPKLLGLQVLRALASIMVAIAHAAAESEHFFGFKAPFSFVPLTKGVDLFFVISGFIIYFSSGKLNGVNNAVSVFLKNRFVRVVPLYYLFTTFIVITLLAFPAGLKETKFDIWQIITSYLFVPYERYDGRIAPVLSLGWTLNYEMYFYALFAFCLFLKRDKLAFSIIALLALISLVGVFVPKEAPAAFRIWSNSIILEFAFGVLIARMFEIHREKFKRSASITSGMVLTGFIGLYFLNLPDQSVILPRFISAGLPSALIVTGMVLFIPASIEARLPKLLVHLGDSSYSLYLSHRFVLRPVQIIMVQLFGPIDLIGALYVAVATVASLVVGHLSFLLMEQPLLKLLKGRK